VDNDDDDDCSAGKTSQGIARSNYAGWTDMASAEREPITGVWSRDGHGLLGPSMGWVGLG